MSNKELLRHKRINAKNIDTIFVKRFGSEYLDYRKKWTKAGKFAIPDFPIHLDIETIDNCNYRCKFCFRNKKSAITEDINKNTQFDMN